LLEPFFTANEPILHFADGLVFFLLGVVAALAGHTFRASRLGVTQALPWLATFGLLVGVAKWGVVFIPLQAAYLSDSALDLLRSLQAGLLVLAHGALLLFGLRLMPYPRWLVPLMLAGVGLTLIALSGPLGFQAVARPLAAYGLGLPGALLSARGLLLQAAQLSPFYSRPARALRLSAWAFVLSVPLGPLAIPRAGGGSVRLLGVPAEVGLIAGGLFLVLTLVRGFDALRVESQRRMERAERREALLEERYRLGKELNDGVLQDLVAAGLFVEALEPGLPEEGRTYLGLVRLQLQGAVDRLRPYLMDLSPMDWSEPDPYRGLAQLVAEFQANSLLPARVDLSQGFGCDAGVVTHIYTVAHEALANVRRHAGACEVDISLRPVGQHWTLVIADTGVGFDPERVSGPGLDRMADTARKAQARLKVESQPGKGTRIALNLPAAVNSTTNQPLDT